MDNRSAAQRYRDLPGEEKGRFNLIKSLLNDVSEIPSYSSLKICKDIPEIIETLEYIMQDILGYDRNKEFHRYWCRVEKCTCPILDNDDQLGYGRIISEDCPFHGKEENESNSCLQSSKNYHK